MCGFWLVDLNSFKLRFRKLKVFCQSTTQNVGYIEADVADPEMLLSQNGEFSGSLWSA